MEDRRLDSGGRRLESRGLVGGWMGGWMGGCVGVWMCGCVCVGGWQVEHEGAPVVRDVVMRNLAGG